jgi:hypothetical protein
MKKLRETRIFSLICAELRQGLAATSRAGQRHSLRELGPEKMTPIWSGSDSFVAMVQATDLRDLPDSAQVRRLNRSADRSVLVQTGESGSARSIQDTTSRLDADRFRSGQSHGPGIRDGSTRLIARRGSIPVSVKRFSARLSNDEPAMEKQSELCNLSVRKEVLW